MSGSSPGNSGGPRCSTPRAFNRGQHRDFLTVWFERGDRVCQRSTNRHRNPLFWHEAKECFGTRVPPIGPEPADGLPLSHVQSIACEAPIRSSPPPPWSPSRLPRTRAASRGSLASKALGKRTFYETIDLDLEAAYARAMEVMAESALTPDGRESFRAFLEKRPGVYPRTR
jgi:hypothetical protein